VGPCSAWWVRFPTIHNPAASCSLSSLVEKRAAWLALTTILTWLGHGGIIPLITLHARQQGITRPGLFCSLYALRLVLSRAVSGRTHDQHDPRWPVSAGLVLLFLPCASLNVLRAALGYLFAAWTQGPGFGNLAPCV
jgi:MFS family permease